MHACMCVHVCVRVYETIYMRMSVCIMFHISDTNNEKETKVYQGGKSLIILCNVHGFVSRGSQNGMCQSART
jgi:hypothetical protein